MPTPSELAAELAIVARRHNTSPEAVRAITDVIAGALARDYMDRSHKGPLSSARKLAQYLTEPDAHRRTTYPAAIRWWSLLHEAATHVKENRR